jgi:hypothetical protein
MRKLIVLAIAGLFSPGLLPFSPGQTRYLPDFTGRVSIRLNAELTAMYQLSAAETEAFHGNLERLREILLAIPAFNPPRGHNASGRIQAANTSLCPKLPCPKVPVTAWCDLLFPHYIASEGKPVLVGESGTELSIWINDPEPPRLYNHFQLQEMVDPQRRRIYFLPPKSDEVQGFPIYHAARDNVDMLILTKNSQPYWLPLSREAYLQAAIRDIEGYKAKVKVSRDFSGDIYRKWMAEREQRQEGYRLVYEQMKKTDPKKAEAFRQEMEKTEQDVAARLKRDMEKNPPVTGPLLTGYEEILSRHQAALAAMTPAQRQMQARYLRNKDANSPNLVAPDSGAGHPLVIVNPNFMNPNLARTAIQLMAVFFDYGSLDFNPDHPEEWDLQRDPSPRRMNELRKTTNWNDFMSLLSKGPATLGRGSDLLPSDCALGKPQK